MKILTLIILSGLFLTSCFLNQEEEPDPDILIEVSGQILFSCEKPVPLANLWVGIGSTYLYTDTLGRFSGKVFSSPRYPMSIYLNGSKSNYDFITLVNSLALENTDFGVLYASKPKLVPLIVFYDLSKLKLSAFPEIAIQYEKLGPNQTKIGKKPEDFLKPDTILMDTENIILYPSKSNRSNFKIDYLLGGYKYDRDFTVTNFCDTARAIVTF